MEKQYAPYSKWLGTAFHGLRIKAGLAAKTWKTRDRSIAKAYSVMAQQHNALKITKPLATNTSDYYCRPYSVIHGERFAKAIMQAIKDPKIKRIKTNVGSIDQFTDSTNVVEDLALCKKLRSVCK